MTDMKKNNEWISCFAGNVLRFLNPTVNECKKTVALVLTLPSTKHPKNVYKGYFYRTRMPVYVESFVRQMIFNKIMK